MSVVLSEPRRRRAAMSVVMSEPDTATALALAPSPSALLTPLPVFTGVEMTAALRAYRDLQAALDNAMPDQIMTLDGKPFRKKGYWRALATAFNLTVEPILERREALGTLEDGSENYTYSITYKASTSSGRAAFGDGACSASEKQRGRMKASEHNVRSHAHTRAFNRAVSNLVGFGEVSAEEVDREDVRHQAPAPVAAPARPKPTMNYDAWLASLQATAAQGTAALKAAWESSDIKDRAYLTGTAPTVWSAIKATAAHVDLGADA